MVKRDIEIRCKATATCRTRNKMENITILFFL